MACFSVCSQQQKLLTGNMSWIGFHKQSVFAISTTHFRDGLALFMKIEHPQVSTRCLEAMPATPFFCKKLKYRENHCEVGLRRCSSAFSLELCRLIKSCPLTHCILGRRISFFAAFLDNGITWICLKVLFFTKKLTISTAASKDIGLNITSSGSGSEYKLILSVH